MVRSIEPILKIDDFRKRKRAGGKISFVTCYDYTSARSVSQSAIDCILVGDSAAMMMHGATATPAATIEMMTAHTQAVARGAANKFIVADLPFPTYRMGLLEAMKSVDRLIKAGAHAVKMEGLYGHEEVIQNIVGSGVPVMGHIGLTPQWVHALGGYRVQGKDEASQRLLHEQALKLQELGCFAIVLECIPAHLAAQITAELEIPTIGIGAGANCDGQVLVWHDLLGLQTEFQPRFVRKYMDGAALIHQALEAYDREVKSGAFPNAQESY